MNGKTASDHSDAFDRLYGIIQKLRSPEGCPWDRKQTPDSLRPFLIEEIYECFEAMDDGDSEHVKEELGDIFMLITMISYMKEQEQSFSVASVLQEVSDKLVRRHPHVFGDVELETSEEVIQQWAEIKTNVEGRKVEGSLLDKVPRTMPPLERATRLQGRAADVGFDWSKVNDVLAKVREEIDELGAAIGDSDSSIEDELGDLLFSLVNLARFLKIDPTLALHRTNTKFTSRFSYIEREMQKRGQELSRENMGLMDELWNQAKSR